MDQEFIKNVIKKLNNRQVLIAASKTRSKDEILKAYGFGINDFGENYVQELIAKHSENDKFNWHFIGRIQTNKIKDIVSRVVLIHGVSRIKEVQEINKQSLKINKISNILIEVNLIPNDLTHGGIREEELEGFLKECSNYPNINVKGFMIIGPNSDNKKEIENVFIKGEKLFNIYSKKYQSISELSMGMSDDYEIALKHSATMIRIGTKIFGPRDYSK